MDRSALVDALKQNNAYTFVESHLFDRVPEMFGGDRELYIGWKRTLAQAIQVDPVCLTVVGSAAVGWSLNPAKSFKAFDAQSDIDVAVISHHYFTVAWRYLRANSTRRMRVDTRTRNAWDEHVTRYIYWGTIATDRLLGVLPFGLEWMRSQTHMSSVDPARGRTINMRIYDDFESLRSYQVMSVKKLRDLLFEGRD